MKVTLSRSDNAFGMTAKTENGHQITVDASKAAGGNNSGASPMQYVLIAGAGCSTIDIIDILKKQREPLDDINVDVEGFRAETIPKVFERIHLVYRLTGNVKPKKASRAVHLSIEKYCSVLKMLENSVKISCDVFLNEQHLETI